MGRLDIQPTGIESPFHDDEIIVSKTDPTGKITYANDVFVRVSRYQVPELIGAPHSIIRHPAMPRVMFDLVWRELQAKREVFAYVLNLARDGAHYWVFAHMTPTLDATGAIVGYHSNRRTASRKALATIEPLYAALLRAERGFARKADAIAASRAVFESYLNDRGQSYDEFVWSL